MNKSAFTLLEAILYLALAAVFLGGVLTCVYALASSSAGDESKILLLSEGQFLQEKIIWAFLGAKNFLISQDNQMLTVNKYSAGWPLVFGLQNGYLQLAVNGNTPADLNAAAVTVNSLQFQDVPATTSQPEGLEVGFILKTLDSRGRLASQNFSFTEYLQQ